MVRGVNHVTVLVKDKEVAREYYQEILGLETFVVGKSLWMKAGQQFLHITNNSGQIVAGSFYHFAIEVDNLWGFIQGLINKGIEVFDLDKDMKRIKINSELEDANRQFFVNDPDGNLVELVDSENKFFKQGLG